MSIESPDDTAPTGLDDSTEPSLAERSPAVPDDAAASALEALRSTHDSAPPMSRKLAPPPKPKRDSGHVSSPPSARPAGEVSDALSTSSSALRAPGTPVISYSGDGVEAPAELPEPPPAIPSMSSGVPQSVPPPIPPRRRSNPALSEEAGDVPRPGSDPELATKGASNVPRPITAPPRPRSEPPPASQAPESSAPTSSVPPSSSAIFAMRIIAVGESQRPPAVAEQAEIPADAFVPSASRLGTGPRRSSRPVMATITNEIPAPPMPLVPPPAGMPRGMMPSIDVEFPPDMTSPVVVPPPLAAEAAPTSDALPIEETAPVVAATANHDGAEELADADLAPDSGEKKVVADEAEELGREDAISMQPEEVAALQAEMQAKAEAIKPPPPPKRSTGALGSAPPLVESAPAPPAPPPAAPSAPPSATPPTPDLAAAKAAQRSKTRQPWWEDLFNEDFMRASSRVSDEHVRREVTFIEESLGVAAGGIVLDLGCGAGHHAVELASRGYGVVGYDLSLYQLALAADVAQERNQKINFLQGDMREMAFEEMFDGVFSWNTSFGYFEEDKNLAVAQRVFKALRPGGMFLIDVINRDFAAASAPCTVWYEGDSCVCMDDMSVDYISSRLRVKRSIILDDGRTKESLFSLRLYSLHELGKLLHEVGFRVTEASGHPATPGVFFGPNSPRIIMLAQRP